MNRRSTHAALLACAVLLAGAGVAPPGRTIIVAADGSGEFKTVQEAVNAVADDSPTRTVIHLKPGTYAGQVIVPKSKAKITLEGEDARATSVTWDRNVRETIPRGADKFNPGIQILADDFRARNVTFENTSGNHGQALAVRADGDRTVFDGCRIIGWQDTLMVNNGRDYFSRCYIAGRVDFIYGSATAVFDDCEVHSRNGGHVTAASTPQEHEFGFVFLRCKLTGDAVPWSTPPATQPDKVTPLADLGRPWRPYAAVAYLECEIGDHIKPEGWNNWGKESNEKTARYAEYRSTGPGARPDKRFAWAKQLTDDEAKKYTAENVLGGSDHWNPKAD